jgi:hypothetical protein
MSTTTQRGIFARKPIDMLLAELAGEHRLKRALGPVTLTALGIGCIIGAGIFVLTGLAANQYAGPGLVLSFVIAGLGCAFAALCYAEFASMVPVAWSAYTYAYATLGEISRGSSAGICARVRGRIEHRGARLVALSDRLPALRRQASGDGIRARSSSIRRRTNGS